MTEETVDKEKYLKEMIKEFDWRCVANIDGKKKLFIDKDEISIIVNLESGDYNFEFCVPNSRADLYLGRRGIFYHREPFLDSYEQIMHMAVTLKESSYVQSDWMLK